VNTENEPQKMSGNLVLIIAVLVFVFICCCVVALCLGTGAFLFMRADDVSSPQPIEQFELPAFEEPAEQSEPYLPDEPQNSFLPTVPVDEEYDPALPQGGRGDNALRKRVWDFVLRMAESKAACENPLPAATVIVVTVEPDASGVWEETWTLFCGNGPTPVFRVIFTPNENGTINFSPGLISQ
jgi:hypothetical protein